MNSDVPVMTDYWFECYACGGDVDPGQFTVHSNKHGGHVHEHCARDPRDEGDWL